MVEVAGIELVDGKLGRVMAFVALVVVVVGIVVVVVDMSYYILDYLNKLPFVAVG